MGQAIEPFVPRGHLLMCRHIFGFQIWGDFMGNYWHLVVGILLKACQCTGQIVIARSYLNSNVHSAELEKVWPRSLSI